MKIFEKKQSRERYFETQILYSERKFTFCEVSLNCVRTWKKVVMRCQGGVIEGPIMCLATRNGREIDLFRAVFFGSIFKQGIIEQLEIRDANKYAWGSRLKRMEEWGKSDISVIAKRNVYGVELNPAGKRSDVLTASFDDLPKEWEGRFQIVYSNSLDHAQDPYKATKDWYRILQPGGYLILGWPGEKIAPSEVDIVGNIGLVDVEELFPGELIYFNKFGNAFCEAIIRKAS